MDCRPACRWWMMIARPSHQHPSPLLNVDSSAGPPLTVYQGDMFRSQSARKVPPPPSRPRRPLDHYHGSQLKELSPYTERLMHDVIRAPFHDYTEQFLHESESACTTVAEWEFHMVTHIIRAVLDETNTLTSAPVWGVCTTTRWIAVTFWTRVQGPQRTNHNA